MKSAFILFSLLGAIVFQTNWVLKKDQDGIKVYVGDSELSEVKQFKVKSIIESTPEKIANAIIDVENNYKWLDNVNKADLIERISDTELIYRQTISVPFPFTDREVVQHVTVEYLPNSVIKVVLNDKNDAAPKNDDYVRMPIARGFWLLSPDKGKTKAEYTYLADPGGSMPAWLINSFLVDSPYKTIKSLKLFLAQNG